MWIKRVEANNTHNCLHRGRSYPNLYFIYIFYTGACALGYYDNYAIL
jgi:hypothetical protein